MVVLPDPLVPTTTTRFMPVRRVTIRSEFAIDYTTFGELDEIVRGNWVSVDAIFSRRPSRRS
jgi:hypothetical protein